ncbi:hypothetical protein I302_100109 [Kwoniella bestiolae CBS 10118]|uniref:F-box domain-containing protein n=1 Tax=Kwoniella bestiolae CBS 10118 TaxID=1296100 RepID=A0A1B9G492_9TREE|nr:hypothetical protein I302_03483 [Kwoniella bestiolae CBS 10118]OCF25810.1 hypothetical protein I302_03483 [Kwoniella bestiolae CBS 10118]
MSTSPPPKTDTDTLEASTDDPTSTSYQPSFVFDLPPDIFHYLLLILQESCDRSTLLHLSSVNKLFYQLFSPLIYENLEINEWNVRTVFAGMMLGCIMDLDDEYVVRPAIRLLREPKPTVSDEEIIESLGCLAMCFGPRKPPKSSSMSVADEKKKRMSFSKLTREVDRIQNERRERDYEKCDGTSFGRDLISIWNRKVKLLNSVRHLRIKDIAAAREIAAYLGPTQKELQQIPNPHPSTPNGNYETPLIFQNIKTLSLGFDLLSSDRQIDLREPVQVGESAGLAVPPSSQRTLNRLIAKLRPREVCAEWDIRMIVDKDRMVFMRDLGYMCKVWEVDSLTWHVYQSAVKVDKSANGGSAVEVAEREYTLNRRIYQSEVIDFVKDVHIPTLKIIYTDVCSCQIGCSRSHTTAGLDRSSRNNDPCWDELGYAALKIDQVGYGSTKEDTRKIEIVGLPCLTCVGPEDVSQAMVQLMEKRGFDGTEVSLARRRWSDRTQWSRDHLKIISDVSEGRCKCCEGIQEDKFGQAFSLFGRGMRALVQ